MPIEQERKVIFRKEKETPNCIVFAEVAEAGTAPIIGRLYVQKWWVATTTEIEVTVKKVN